MLVDDIILAIPAEEKKHSLMLAIPLLEKSFVESHYRHDSKGQLVFVQGYHNKVLAKPEDLTASKIPNPHPKANPSDEPNQKMLSFHTGDQVFVKYSHKHDQHYMLGAVLSTRKDPSQGGLLVNVRLLDGRLEAYNPNSLVHVHKEYHEERTHEVSAYTDDNGKTIDYKHLNPEQKQLFYDQYKIWFRLHRMGEIKAFNDNKHLFQLEDGTYPTHKNKLSAVQKIQLEKLNKFPVVPLDAIREMVSGEGYTKGKHAALVSQLMDDIKTLEKQGVPSVAFPKLTHKKIGKKEHPYAPPEWMSGMFPSDVEELDMTDKEYKVIMAAKKAMLGDLTPSTEGVLWGNNKDFHYGQPLNHGQVKIAKEEGSTYKPAPVLPPAEDSTKENFFAKLPSTSTKTPKKEAPKVPEPKKEVPKVPEPKKEESKTPEPALFIPSEAPKPNKAATFHEESDDISDLKFTVTANAADQNFGGAHSKYILHDENGNEYLFKPYNSQEVYRSWVDVIAQKVAKKVGLPSADFGSKPISIKVPSGLGGSYSGKTAVGSVQRIVKNIISNNIKDLTSNGFVTAPQKVVEQLQREHVLDWLLGNNDAHAGQFLIDSKGDVIGIDKGHCFKHYKDDVLSLDYDPAGNNSIGNTSVYHTLLKSAKSKKLKLSFDVVKSFIDNELKNLTPSDLSKMILPYAENSVVWKNNPQGLQDLATKRLGSIKKDFEKLYKSVGVEVGTNEVAVPKDNLTQFQHQEDAFQQIDSHFHTKVMDAQGMGCSIMMGGGHVEDMSVLFTPYKWDFNKSNPDHSGKGLEVSFKLLSGHEQDVLAMFDTVQDSDTALTPKHGTLDSTFDPLWIATKDAAKTVNNHCINGGKMPDGKPDETKMNTFAKHFQGLDAFDPKAPIFSVEQIAHNLSDKNLKPSFFDDHISLSHEVAEHYHKIATEVMEAINAQQKTVSKMYGPWSGSYTAKSVNVSKSKVPHAIYPAFKMSADGKLTRKPGNKQASFIKGETGVGESTNYGAVFQKQLDGNITVSYYPHYSDDLKGQNNLRSQQGNFTIDFHNWDGNIDAMHKAREVMAKFGIDHKLSNHEDLECMYLTRVAWHNKANLEHTAEYNKVQNMDNNGKKIEALKALCEKSYGSDPSTLSTYHPIPKWDDNSGHHYFMNPYVLEHLKSDPHTHVLKHDFQATKDASAMTSIAKNGLLSTERRRHLGFDYFGMSSHDDQKSGGASYVFLRGFKPQDKTKPVNGTSSALVFRPELWARTDLIPRRHDQYGVTHNTYGGSGKGKIHDRVKIMDVMNDKGTDQYNDVTVKNGLSMTNWFMGIKGFDYNVDPTDTTKVYNEWINKFKKAILKHKPHVIGHSQFINVG